MTAFTAVSAAALVFSLFVGATSTSTTATSTSTTSTTAALTGIDWLVLPILQFNDDAGIIYGIHFPIVDYGDGSLPYDWYFEIKLRHSTKNRHEHFLLFDLRDLFGVRFTLRAEFLRIADAHYYGIENTAVLRDIDSKFYRYRLTEPRVQTLFSQKFAGDFLWGAGLQFNFTETAIAEDVLLALERPTGFDGGHALIGIFTLAHDTRDSELVPTVGHFVEAYAKAATRPLGSSTSFQGVGLTAQAYYSPVHALVFAQRLMMETLGGDVPFYELARIGGRTSVFGLGGVFTQRGEPESRFIGKTKALSNTEVRYYFPKLFNFATFGLGAFVDVAWVKEPRPSAGGEISVKWKELIIFRIDAGVSAEGTLLYVEGYHLF